MERLTFYLPFHAILWLWHCTGSWHVPTRQLRGYGHTGTWQANAWPGKTHPRGSCSCTRAQRFPERGLAVAAPGCPAALQRGCHPSMAPFGGNVFLSHSPWQCLGSGGTHNSPPACGTPWTLHPVYPALHASFIPQAPCTPQLLLPSQAPHRRTGQRLGGLLPLTPAAGEPQSWAPHAAAERLRLP